VRRDLARCLEQRFHKGMDGGVIGIRPALESADSRRYRRAL
jgi:hypothetical protein